MTKQSRITSLRGLLRFFRETGVRYEKRHGGHICVYTPNGPVFIPSTPSDRRSLKNAVSILRRHGIPIPRGHKNTKKRLDYLQKTRPVDPEVWAKFIESLEVFLGSPLPAKSPVDKLIPWLFGQHLVAARSLRSPDSLRDFGQLRDWWMSERPDINKYSYVEAVEEAKAWHRAMEKRKVRYAAEVAGRGELVLKFPDGASWYLLKADPHPSRKSIQHLMKVGDALGHCYGSQGGARTAGWYRHDYDLYTLYDANGEPHLTVSVPEEHSRPRRRRDEDRSDRQSKVSAFAKAMGMPKRRVEEANVTGNEPITGGSRWMPYWQALVKGGVVGVDPVEFFGSLNPAQQKLVLEVIREGRTTARPPARGLGHREGLETEDYWLNIEGLETGLEGKWGPLHEAVLANADPQVQASLSDWFDGVESDEDLELIPEKFWAKVDPSRFPNIFRSLQVQRGSLVAQRRARVRQLVDRATEEASPGELAALWLSTRRPARLRRKRYGAKKLSAAEVKSRIAFQAFAQKESTRLLSVSPAVRQRVGEEAMGELLGRRVGKKETELSRRRRGKKYARRPEKVDWLTKLKPKTTSRRAIDVRKRQGLIALVEGGLDARQVVTQGLKTSRSFFTQQQLSKLWMDHPELRTILLGADNIPKSLVRQAAGAKGARLRAAALKGSKASPALWRRHLEDPSVMVRRIARTSLSGELGAKWLAQYGLSSPGLRGVVSPAQTETLKFLRGAFKVRRGRSRSASLAYLKRMSAQDPFQSSAKLLVDVAPPGGSPHWLRTGPRGRVVTVPRSRLSVDWWRAVGTLVYGILAGAEPEALHRAVSQELADFPERLSGARFRKMKQDVTARVAKVLKDLHKAASGNRLADVVTLEKELGAPIPEWLRGSMYRLALWPAVAYVAADLPSTGRPTSAAVRSAVVRGIASGDVVARMPKAPKMKTPKKVRREKRDG
jgi:hypothetical protein